MGRYVVEEQPDSLKVIDTQTGEVIWDWYGSPSRKAMIEDKEAARKIAAELNGGE